MNGDGRIDEETDDVIDEKRKWWVISVAGGDRIDQGLVFPYEQLNKIQIQNLMEK